MLTKLASPATAANAEPVKPCLPHIEFWEDPIPRSGPEAMAIDQWLLETISAPLLRIYRWHGDWWSIGYFGKVDEVQKQPSGVKWVRRWTGGGTVDHRRDWTYSLVIPRTSQLAPSGSRELYAAIHQALALAHSASGCGAALLAGERRSPAGAANGMCFTNPVAADVLTSRGRKIAGAGQRRTRAGVLHQGSIDPPEHADHRLRAQFFLEFIRQLAPASTSRQLTVDAERVASLVESRYGCAHWSSGSSPSCFRNVP